MLQPVEMKSAGKATTIHDDRRQHRISNWPSRPQAILLLVLLLSNAAAATALYHLCKLTSVPQPEPPRLQLCDAKLGPLVYGYSPLLKRTIGDLKLNITFCWK